MTRSLSCTAQLIDRADENDSIQHGDSEQGNETDRGRQIQIHSANPEGGNAPDQCKGYIRDDQERLFDRGKAEVKKNKDHGNCDRNNKHKATSGSLLILKLAAIFNKITGRQGNVVFELGTDFADETAEVATTDVRHDDDSSLSLLPFDLFRPPCHLDRGDLVERDLFASRRAQQNTSHG